MNITCLIIFCHTLSILFETYSRETFVLLHFKHKNAALVVVGHTGTHGISVL